MMDVAQSAGMLGTQYCGISGNRSISDNGLYIPFVTQATHNPAIFAIFKSHPIYREVLEHVDEAFGQRYLNVVAQDNPSFLERIEELRLNDAIGQPITYQYEGIGAISPTTLRYMKVVSDVRKFFGENFETVAEVGVGYGGQMFIIDKLLNIKQYHLFDLVPVLNLVSMYLESHQLNGSYKCMTINQSCGGLDYDLAISNYAFSELPSSLQKLYIKKILLKARRGYLTMNSGLPNSAYRDDKLSLSDLQELLPPFELVDEYPLTSNGNYIIVWGHK
jgi:putative sugar O-methyltransferase